MLRNLGVTAIVSMIMGVTTLALRSAAPPAAQPIMGEQGEQRTSQPQTVDVTSPSQAPPTGMQVTQASVSPSTAIQTAGGIMGGGQAAGGMMMCPCMQMMMGGGMGGAMMGGQMNPAGAAAQPLSNPRTKEQAWERAEQYLDGLGNPNLKVGEVNETAASYEIEVVTKDGSLVNRLIIDKKSGEIKSQY